jgi:DNA/RNA-binding domain of Phe-tRNA-synthetase-like protein
LRAVAEGTLGSINAAVDACNAASFHSGLPISVVDLDRLTSPLLVAIAVAGSSYVFNASGQQIDVSGLLCLHDASGPVANAVKDAQHTKTHPGTVRTLSVVWGARALTGRTTQTAAWYRELLSTVSALTEPCALHEE